MQIALIHMLDYADLKSIRESLVNLGMQVTVIACNADIKDLDSYSGFVLKVNFVQHQDINQCTNLLQHLKIQSNLGKPVLGIAAGAQLLCEVGLLPGIVNHGVGVRIKHSYTNNLMQPTFIRLAEDYQYNAFTRHLAPSHILQVMAESSPARFIIPPGLLAEMQVQGLNLFHYCDADGKLLSELPDHLYAGTDNIAAISNKAGNVLAIVPHIEGTMACEKILQSMQAYIAKGYVDKVAPLHYMLRDEN
jgi:phosphoribosylformylglycinamidine synthase subunit PurQ / glutaminase